MQEKKIPVIRIGILVVVALAAIAYSAREPIKNLLSQYPAFRQLLGKKTVQEQIETYGDLARGRLRPIFEKAGLQYPPWRMAILAFKDRKVLEVYVRYKGGDYKHLHTYPITGASGTLGPKLKDGDFQVPEGVYLLESLEPNTPYHLGLRLNYPNDFDLENARVDGRNKPGGDILIHGSNGSVSCLAVGDVAAEDLFVLAHDTIDSRIAVIICPVDLRVFKAPPSQPNDPVWLPRLYKNLTKSLQDYPAHVQ